MFKKTYSKTGKKCRVLFRLPADVKAGTASLLGEFNEWDPQTKPMQALKAGGFSITLYLPAPGSYRFRYLLDGERWINDDDADSLVPNEHGSEDSVIEV